MEYTSEVFVDFVKRLIVFDKDCKTLVEASNKIKDDRYKSEANEWDRVKYSVVQVGKDFASATERNTNDFRKHSDGELNSDISNKNRQFEELLQCNEILHIIQNARSSILIKENVSVENITDNITINQLLNKQIDFVQLSYEINHIFKTGSKRSALNKCGHFLGICDTSERLLNEHIINLKSGLIKNIDEINQKYIALGETAQKKVSQEWDSAFKKICSFSEKFRNQACDGKRKTINVLSESSQNFDVQINRRKEEFFGRFSPQEFLDEYIRLYSNEPIYDEYKCYKDMPKNVHISTMVYDLSYLDLCDYTKKFLEENYPFMYREDKLCIPYCATFGREFNYLFKFSGNERQTVVSDACDLGMRLFMMLPPGKLNFTFIDPVTLGESFAMFTRLVDVDDRTSEVINGKIWFSPTDIEDKLKIMTDHISNVTQRCLQGKYDNIYEYNKDAEQNAEAYQVLMLMDFPAGMTDRSLKLLEQIVTSGPKCGVFTIIYRNESQYKKVSEKSYPLITNIENNLQTFTYGDSGNTIKCSENIKEHPIIWRGTKPTVSTLDSIISTLKKGIKSAEKVVIGIEKVDARAESTNSTTDGIRIPIGIHGANEVQYLTLGVGGSHHALIAGVAGSGKSSLLHTIILRALTQYSPEELNIYLVDFKRGVEFKIYADFELPSFKVIAIESEREFGYNILTALEREQKIRADLFKKNHVDKIEEYRATGKKMPRVLVIMDEFHELFSSANDEFAKKSATLMERIVRQGRAFGVHMILASQSYSNINGIDRAVFDQMAVRIVLKCSKADANLLLDGGSNEIDLISIDDPGRAVYNSEAGNKEYNSHFRVAYIAPETHRGLLQEISNKTKAFITAPTRVLLSNIEDNRYSIFNNFDSYSATNYNAKGRIYIGESLNVTNNMLVDLTRTEYSNILMIGNDTEKARSMFAFAVLSLCIDYWIINHKTPDEPFIYIMNYKPLEDSYFVDTPKLLSDELSEYIKYIPCGDSNTIQNVVAELYDNVCDSNKSLNGIDKYLFVFGYQRAEELKSDAQISQEEDILNTFGIMSTTEKHSSKSVRDMYDIILKSGPQMGVHSILWQDSFKALDEENRDMMSYFTMKIAFDMMPEEFSQFVGANDTSLMSENNAIYYNRARDNQKFRPYQSPDTEWLKEIASKLK